MSYFKSVWDAARTTMQGLKITTAHLFRKPYTLQYPDELPDIDKVTHRGIHEFDTDRCINCDQCAKACPVDCIYIESIGKGKDAVMTRYDIDYSKCIFCALCVPPCPTDCIQLGEKYSLIGHTRDEMVVPFHHGIYPIQELTDKAKESVEEYEDAGLFEKKDEQREEFGLPAVTTPQNRGKGARNGR